jgi:hypothetical protein
MTNVMFHAVICALLIGCSVTLLGCANDPDEFKAKGAYSIRHGDWIYLYDRDGYFGAVKVR